MEEFEDSSNVDGKQEQLAASPDLFRAYTEGNVRMPQHGLAILTYVSNAFLRSGESIEDFSRMHLSDEQVEKLLQIMHRMHTHHGVPVAAESGKAEVFGKIEKKFDRKPEDHGVIDNSEIVDRLRELWDMSVKGGIQLIYRITGILIGLDNDSIEKSIDDMSIEELIPEINIAMKNPEVSKKVSGVINTMFDTLRSADMDELLRQYKGAHTLSGHKPHYMVESSEMTDEDNEMMERREKVHESKSAAIAAMVVDRIEKAHPEFEGKINPDDFV